MKNKLTAILTALAIGAALYLFWPLIRGVLIVVLAVLLVFVIYVVVQSQKEKEKIMQDPVQHFAKQKMKQDILDAEYREKEIKD